MKADAALVDTANLFLALGDKTRLRLLNLMRDREVCVSSFTGVLGQSQPKISRHLAYLRNAGVVEVRRDGKWMHYSISTSLDDNSRRLLVELFKWMENHEGLDRDRVKYGQKFGSIEPSEIPKATGRKTEPKAAPAPRKRSAKIVIPQEDFEPIVYEEPVETTSDDFAEPEVERYSDVRHNELEDFLL